MYLIYSKHHAQDSLQLLGRCSKAAPTQQLQVILYKILKTFLNYSDRKFDYNKSVLVGTLHATSLPGPIYRNDLL